MGMVPTTTTALGLNSVVDYVTIPGSSITRIDVEYDQPYELGQYRYKATPTYTISIHGGFDVQYKEVERAVRKQIVGPYTDNEKRAPQVKRRLYLFTDPSTNKVRFLAFGFRSDDEGTIHAFAENDERSLALEIEPSEVDVRWIAPPPGLD